MHIRQCTARTQERHNTKYHCRCRRARIYWHTLYTRSHSNIQIQENSQRFYLIFNLITGKSLVDDAVAVVCGEHTTNFRRYEFCVALFIRLSPSAQHYL